jgi:hypothetical protein
VVASNTLSWLSSLALVLGALLVGDAINGAVVTNQYPATAPAAVLRVLFGIVLIWLGARVRTPPEYAPSESAEGKSAPEAPEPGAEDHEFDPELSPLGDGEPTHDRQRDRAGPEADDAESGIASGANDDAGTDSDNDNNSDTGADDDTSESAGTGEDASDDSAGVRGRGQGGS